MSATHITRMIDLATYVSRLREAEAFHGHLCAGMYTGVKMALYAQTLLSLPAYPDRDLIVVAEIDRCLTDAVMSVTGCRVGRRTMKIRDWGRFAASFVRLPDGQGVRLAQRDGTYSQIAARLTAAGIDLHDRDQAAPVFLAFPLEEHFAVRPVTIAFGPDDIPGKPKSKVNCASCGETVMDGRHLMIDGRPLCRPCHLGMDAPGPSEGSFNRPI